MDSQYQQQQQQQQHAPGGHYSGHNPIPTVKQFVDSLDNDKRARDKRIDQEAVQKQGQPATENKLPEKQLKGTEKRVTDPTTGREVVIADVSKDMINEVKNPHIVVPNANLNKETVGNKHTLPSSTSQLTIFSPSRRIPRNRSRTTSITRMSLHPQTQLPKVPQPTCPSTAKRQTSSSTLHPQSVMSPCSRPSRPAPMSSAQEYS